MPYRDKEKRKEYMRKYRERLKRRKILEPKIREKIEKSYMGLRKEELGFIIGMGSFKNVDHFYKCQKLKTELKVVLELNDRKKIVAIRMLMEDNGCPEIKSEHEGFDFWDSEIKPKEPSKKERNKRIAKEMTEYLCEQHEK